MNPFRLLCVGAMLACSVSSCSNFQSDQRAAEESPWSSWELQSGDLVFQISKSNQSQAIQDATNCSYSHVGIVYRNDEETYVFEAVEPVRIIPWDTWRKRGQGEHVVVKRMKDRSALTPDALRKMQAIGEPWLGKHYDLQFMWSDEQLYCSEVVWKVFERGASVELCPLGRVGDLDLSDESVSDLAQKRFRGGLDNVPLDEPIVTPADLFHAPSLQTIFSTPGAPKN
jgi:hypothetical protein